MIVSIKPLTMAEAQELAGDVSEKKALDDYFKKFGNITKDKAHKMVEELHALGNVKMNDEKIVKIADFMPKNAEEVHKIVNDVALDESEINAILEIVRKY